jgi:hypothetical protein
MSPSSRFLVGFFGGIIALVGAIALVFVGLDEAGRLKAPAFANRLSFDEKLRYLREHPVDGVEALAIGSSTTLHGVDGAVLRRELGVRGDLVNLGVQDIRVNQIRFLADVFLPRFPNVRQVVMVSTTLDFKNCDGADTQFFNPDHVLDYLPGHNNLYYYFKYLDVEGTFKRADEIRNLRNTRDDLESVSFDKYGGLLLEVAREHISDRVWSGDPITLDPPCYASLRGLAEDLRAKGIEFTYVISPMRPGYLAGRDPDGSLLAEHRRRLRAALEDTGAVLIDAHEALSMPEEAFFDAYHLNREEARQLTHFVTERLLAAAHPPDERPSTRPAAAHDSGTSAGT